MGVQLRIGTLYWVLSNALGLDEHSYSDLFTTMLKLRELDINLFTFMYALMLSMKEMPAGFLNSKIFDGFVVAGANALSLVETLGIKGGDADLLRRTVNKSYVWGKPDSFIVGVVANSNGDIIFDCSLVREGVFTGGQEESSISMIEVVRLTPKFCSEIYARSHIKPRSLINVSLDTKACKNVRLRCREYPTSLPLYVKLSAGMEYAGCYVSYCLPSTCHVDLYTKFDYFDDVVFEEKETQKNVIIKASRRGGEKVETFVYPKVVWDEVKKRIIDPMRRDTPPEEVGAIFVGPPGTGKSSIARIISEMLTLPVIEVEPNKILSKWVGESEKNLEKVFEEAELNEPSMIFIDEGEWLVASRDLAGGTFETRAYSNLLSMLLKKIAEWRLSGRRIIVVVATNVSIESIDKALMRSGRLGKPVLIPLPDYDAILEYLLARNVPKADAEKMAVKAVGLGLSMAHVEKMYNDYVKLGSVDAIKVEPDRHRGYKRLMPPSFNDQDLFFIRELDGVLGNKMCDMLRNEKSRIKITMASEIAVPIAVAMVTYCKLPALLVTDPTFINEALLTAETTKSVIIFDSDPMVSVIPSIIHKLPTATIFVGLKSLGEVGIHPIEISHHIVGSSSRMIESMIRIVYKYYGVEPSQQELSLVGMQKVDSVICTLIKFASSGGTIPGSRIFEKFCRGVG